ncbi:MAG: zinc-ribbon domain-containing protein [Oscillospiraceae bacterium]|jgi:rRNA maturation endonuclease Nob1|nr:zinc-ribbon domain-containing protein [Oscillospiraceae bacterium]
MYAKKLEYLKGLMTGLQIDPSTNEYKLFSAVIEVLDNMSDALADAEEDIAELEDSMDELEDTMDNIAEMLEDDIDDGDDDEDDDDDEEYEITCPGCGHVFVVDEDTLFEGGTKCASCGEKLSFDIGDCECGHCHGHKHDHE